MGVPGSANMLLAAGEAEAYQIDYSLRFEDASEYLYRNFGSASSSTTQTWSFWVKTGWEPMQDDTYHCILCSSNNQTIWRYTNGSGSGNYEDLILSGTFNGWSTRHSHRDPGAWMHVMIVYDTTNGTAINRLRHYYNGVNHPKENGPDPGSSANIGFGQSGTHNIGRQVNGGEHFEGLIAEFHMVDGQALNPTEFGEFSEEHGGWVPKAYSGSYGNNGFYLKFDPSASNGIGHDHSGNGNHWSATGFTTNSTFISGDCLFDTPTTNCSSFNPLNDTESGYSQANSNQNASGGAGTYLIPGTFAVRSGKWYCEFEVDSWSSASARFGWTDMSGDEIDHCERNTFTVMHYTAGYHYIFQNYGDGGSFTQLTPDTATIVAGDILGLALDADNNYVYFYRNGSLLKTINLNSYFTAGTKYLAPWVGFAAGSGSTNYYCNFGGQFTNQYSPPSGYSLYRASNLDDPPIKNPKEHVKAVIYTGNGSSQSITLGFQPDLVWIKDRDASTDHMWIDSVRGASKILKSVGTGAEETDSNTLTSFNSTGFSIGNSGSNPSNINGRRYSAIGWKKGATPGFDIVAYTGTGSDQLINHSLGVVPAFAMVKRRVGNASWWAWHQVMGNNYNANNNMFEFSGNGPLYSDDVFDGFTASQFRVGTDPDSNNNGTSYVMYLWSEVEGFSKFGEYPGNGSSNGPFVYTGFKPAVLITKTANGEWYLHDNAREIDNPNVNVFKLNRSDSDTANAGFYEIDFLSNGFKIRTGNTSVNWSGRKFYFMAWAETPFKYTTAK